MEFKTQFTEIGKIHDGHVFTKDKPIMEYKEYDDGTVELDYVYHDESGEVLTEDVIEQVQLEMENVITPQIALQYEMQNGKGSVHPKGRKGVYGLDHTQLPEHSADLMHEVKKAYAILNSGFVDSNGNVKPEYIIDESDKNHIEGSTLHPHLSVPSTGKEQNEK